MSLTAASLHAVLLAHLPGDATSLAVALSGGPDSAALLSALASLPPQCLPLPLRALHVDHGLQEAAAGFRAHCVALCTRWHVPLQILRARVEAPAGASLEAAARNARYAALAHALVAGECLLTAHHAEDQAETLLLQALRGAGLKGLAAMPVSRTLGPGHHLRLLLGVPRASLLELGAALEASGTEDPMNSDLRFDRNYLRREVWPALARRWPAAGSALARGARLLAQAQELVDEGARRDLARLRDGASLRVPGLRALAPARRHAAVREWLAERGAQLPSEARLGEALRQVFSADVGQLPAVIWGDHALRRYRRRLFLTAAQPPRLGVQHEFAFEPGVEVALGAGLGSLLVITQRGGLDRQRLNSRLMLRPRAGGENLKRHAATATQSLQHLCQDMGILPWLRDALPLVFCGEDLVAVGDLWLGASFCAAAGAPGLGFAWRQAPLLV